MAGGNGGAYGGGAAGGTGYTGQAGAAGRRTDGGAVGGVGGGGGGGGAGGAGGSPSGVNAAGGSGGTSTHKDGYDGSAGASNGGGGGGGGGLNGYAGAGTGTGADTLADPAASFTGSAGGAGGNGGTNGDGGGGGAGGYGAIASGINIQIAASTRGGTGGVGGAVGANADFGGGGGDGGAGFAATAAGAMVTTQSSGSAVGGAGGAAGEFSGAGAGGVGIAFTATASGANLSNAGTTTGGAGGSNSFSDGGAGGAGVAFAGNSATLTNQSTGMITGGSGGSSGHGDSGRGGHGVTFAASGNLTNAGTITGGSGGSGYTGGSGGVGVVFFGASSTLTNQSTGTITGGQGGSGSQGTGFSNAGIYFAQSGALTNAGTITGGAGVDATSSLNGTQGGAGVYGDGITIVNTGTIAGGAGGSAAGQVNRSPGPDGDAIVFTGGTNTLALGSSSKLTGAIDIKAGTLTFDQTAGANLPDDVSVSNTIIGGGAVVKAGSGTLTLSGQNTYAGGTAIKSGAIAVASDGNLGAATSGITLAGGTLETTVGFASARAVTLVGNGTVEVDGTATTTLSGTLAELNSNGFSLPGSLTKAGTGTLVLTGSNTYTDGTTLDGGELSVGSDSNLGDTSGGLTFDGGTLQVTGTAFTSTARNITWGTQGGGFDIADAGNNFTVNQALTNGGALVKSGAGTLTLSGTNTYTGGTFVSAGTLSVAADTNLGDASGDLVLGGTLDTTASFTSAREIDLSGTGVFQVDTGTTTLSGTISPFFFGNGALTKTGAGTLTLSGANTYTGDTTINAGTLQLGDGTTNGSVGGAIADNSVLALNPNGAQTFANTISGSGVLNKIGTGTAVLSGANTYSGNTTIDAGTLAISSDGNLGATTGGLIFDGGTLETTATLSSGRGIVLDQTGVIEVDAGTGGTGTTPNVTTLTGRISGGAPLVKTGGGILQLSGTGNSYSGGTTIDDGTLDLAAATSTTGGFGPAGTGDITFDGSSSSPATLALESAAQPMSGGTFGNTLDDFGDDDQLDLKGLVYNGLSSVTPLTPIGNTLRVSESGDTENFTLGGAQQPAYYARSDGDGGTLVTDSPVVCYASGTLIRTDRGDIPVEALSVGDRVVTSTGEYRPIKWLGHRIIDCGRHSHPEKVLPVRIAAHALGPNKPSRDLYVSPGHSICVDVVGEVLIPAEALVNGATVRQVEVDEVTYWHVELDSHDVLLAENLACESYLDMGNRAFFAESEVVRLDMTPDVIPDANSAQRTHADFCRPYHDGGPLIETVRAQMRGRALALGWRLSDELEVHLEVDGARVDPVVCGNTLRVLVPAGAKDVAIVSPTARPHDTVGAFDRRELGLDVMSLAIEYGAGSAREIALDDPRLDLGFHAVEDGVHRWTNGCARLPAEFWAGCRTSVVLRLDLGGLPVARWVAPGVDVRDERSAA